jgi:hypothetical protein
MCPTRVHEIDPAPAVGIEVASAVGDTTGVGVAGVGIAVGRCDAGGDGAWLIEQPTRRHPPKKIASRTDAM